MSLWKNSLDKNIIEKARKRIINYNKNIPKVLDPFSGGCSIPLESLRLGCETYASDYNPVASLIAKSIIEEPFRERTFSSKEKNGLKPQIEDSLISDIKKWSLRVLEEAKEEIGMFYPAEKNGDVPVGYLWARSIPCQNPKCGKEIPLIKQFWLANKSNKKIALYPEIINKKIQFKIVGDGKEKIPRNFDPKKGTISRGTAVCLVCGYSVEGKKIKKLFAERKNDEILNTVIVKSNSRSGKTYRIAKEKDLEIFRKTRLLLKEKRKKFQEKYGIEPIPDEMTPEGKGSGAERAFSVRLYSMNTYNDLYNDRQKVALLVFLEKILESYDKIQKEENSVKAKQILLYISIIFDRLVDKNSNLARYQPTRETIGQVFSRPALPMIWDYVELNPFTNTGWANMEDWVLRFLDHLVSIDSNPGIVRHSSATNLPFSNEFFDAVITDPPYYDNIPYSHLSDFFYVWLKRTLGSQFTDLFSTPLTPKKDEIVVYSNGPDGWEGGKQFFEKMLKKSFQEIHRVLKPEGIAVIVYAHKSTDGWETLINSLLQSGLVVTAAWPIHTEMKSRLRATESAALASSIYMIARKWQKEPIGFYREIRSDLKRYLNKKLELLWKEGISGADFFIAAIGTAIEVFGKYDKIVDDGDNEIQTLQLLDDVRKIVTDYAINKVIKGEFFEDISQRTRFYILWRWAYGEARVPYDDALKMAQSVGIDLEQKWNDSYIVKEKEIVRVLGPDERSDLEESVEMIDVLHNALLLWKNQNRATVKEFLEKKGHQNSDVLKRVAQAISESLPLESTEKKWIDGFLTGFRTTDSQSDVQSKLF